AAVLGSTAELAPGAVARGHDRVRQAIVARRRCHTQGSSRVGSNEMRLRRRFAETSTPVGLALLLVSLAGGGAAAVAQDQSPGPTFTAEQADRGHAAYRSSCQDCHGSTLDNGEFGGPPLKGGYFRGRWGAGSVAVLYGYLGLAMPPDRPGQLSPQTYA